MNPQGPAKKKKIRNYQFPFQNTSLNNLKYEKWKAIPGFEGCYEVSTYGRIKSLSRRMAMNSPHGGEYMSREMIRKCKLETRRNKTVQENLYTVMITLSNEGMHYNFSVPRLVYYVFREKFDLLDRSTLISYRDGDGRNTHVSNLVKKSIVELKLNSYKIGRSISNLSKLSKPVTQFDAEGNPIGVFPSMYEAGNRTGLNKRAIAVVASGAVHMYKGFFWKRGKHSKKLDLNTIKRTKERETVHTHLMQRLGIKRMDGKNILPCLNLSTETMRGEHWKDVPGYEGLYEVSTMGRVKALQKVTSGKQTKWMPEQIQRIQVDFRENKKGKHIPGSTFACMAKDGNKRLVSIPRLVYYLFVEKFEISDPAWRIYYKDNNPLNVVPTNLILKRGVYSILKRDT